MKKITKIISAAVFSTALLFVFQSTASAHVTVKPVQTIAGASETFTVNVPTEKNIPTTKVAVRIPANVEFYSYQAVPGWNVELSKNSSGRVQTVTWTAHGTGIAPGEFQQFQFRAANPKKVGNVAWNAYQTYKDGSVVEWTGKENSETPHAITHVVKEADTEKGEESGNLALPILATILSASALILSIITLVAGRKKKDEAPSDVK